MPTSLECITHSFSAYLAAVTVNFIREVLYKLIDWLISFQWC